MAVPRNTVEMAKVKAATEATRLWHDYQTAGKTATRWGYDFGLNPDEGVVAAPDR